MASFRLSELLVATCFHQLLMRVELDTRPIFILTTFFACCMLSIIRQANGEQGRGVWNSMMSAWLTIARVLTYLTINVFTYRAFLHPLNSFPGPFGAKLSKFWTLWKVAQSNIRWYTVLDKLHMKYGDYVRTGPREIVMFDAEAIMSLLGPSSKLIKGPFYDGLEDSLHACRDKSFHKQERKVWDRAFKSILPDYGPSIEAFTYTLLQVIERNVGKGMIINDLCVHYSYDVTSSLAFGDSAHFLEGEQSLESADVVKNIQEGILAIGLLAHVPWVLNIVNTFSFAGPLMKFNKWSADQVEKRLQVKNPEPDIMGHLMAAGEDSPAGRTLLNSSSRLIIGAGSDTTSTALTAIFILLSCHQDYQTRLRNEVTTTFETRQYTSAAPQLLLDGIINEALRLFPPILFGSQRVTPLEGMEIGKIFIPGDTVVSIATWQVHHDPRYFVRPNEFIPERWTTKPELVLNKTAFIPFSTGRYNCVGKGLALMEIRSVIARTIANYKVKIVDEKFDERKFFSDTRDHITAGIPNCEVVFDRVRDDIISL